MVIRCSRADHVFFPFSVMSSFSPRLAYEPLHVQQGYAAHALSGALRYMAAHSPFYKELFARHNTDISSIRSIQDLEQLPFTTKDDMQHRNWEFLCVPRSEVREYTATSGTMGRPVTIALTSADLERLAYNESQSFRCATGSAEDIYQLALTLDRQFMAGMAYYSGIRAMGASLVRTGPGLPQMQWETIRRLDVNSLVIVPSFLLSLAEWAESHGIELSQSSVTKAICIGESIRRADFSMSALGTQIASRWPIRLFNTYAATELQTAFTECAAGRGGHHQPDLVIVEIIGDDGRQVADGTPGEVVITTIGVEAMPLLRYRTGDLAALHSEPCTCGRLSKRLGPVVGRKGQMIKFRGTTLYPPAIFDVLHEADYILEYAAEVYTGEQGTDELRLHLHTELPLEECDIRLRDLLQSRLRVLPQMQYQSGAAIQSLIMPAGSRKLQRFIDNRKAL